MKRYATLQCATVACCSPRNVSRPVEARAVQYWRVAAGAEVEAGVRPARAALGAACDAERHTRVHSCEVPRVPRGR